MNNNSDRQACEDSQDVAEFLQELRHEGYRLFLRGEGDKLRVTPPMPPDLLSEVKDRKIEICACLLRACWSPDSDPPLPDPWIETFVLPGTWQQEYALGLSIMAWRLHICCDPNVRAKLRELTLALAPTTETEWLALGTRWRQAEYELRQHGRLPAAPWPHIESATPPWPPEPKELMATRQLAKMTAEIAALDLIFSPVKTTPLVEKTESQLEDEAAAFNSCCYHRRTRR